MANSLQSLTLRVRRARSAMWASLTMTLNPDLASTLENQLDDILSKDDWWPIKPGGTAPLIREAVKSEKTNNDAQSNTVAS